jgi:plasmid replication initiation protein
VIKHVETQNVRLEEGVNLDHEVQVNNNVVTKSNILIEANYKLTIIEQKIVLFLVSKIRKDDNDFETYTLPIKQFYELLGNKGNPKYSEMKKITKNLIGKVVEIKEDRKLKQISWLSYVEYNENDGSVNLSFDPRLRPYLLQLKREFTSYKLKNVMELKSSYSIRIYEVLKKWQSIKEVEIPLKELREMVGATDKYHEYHNFKKRVITPSQKEIEEKTDISFDYQEIKKGKRVTSIRFIIHAKNKVITREDEISNQKEDWLESLYAQLNLIFKERDYMLSKDAVERWVGLADKVWGSRKYVEINKLAQQSFQIRNIKNHIAFITHILNEKVKCVENGTSHHRVNVETSVKKVVRKEIVPSWFEDYSVDDVKHSEDKSIYENRSLDDVLKSFNDNYLNKV